MRTYRSLAHMCLPARTLVRARNMRTVCRDRMTWADTRTRGAREMRCRGILLLLSSPPSPLLPRLLHLLLRLLPLLLLMTSRSRFLPPSIRQIPSFPFDKSLPEIPTKKHIALPLSLPFVRALNV